MPDDFSKLTPEELERVLWELAGGFSPESDINVLPVPIDPGGEIFKELLERIPAITFWTSFLPGKQNVYVSPQIEEILGYTPEEWLAKPSLWQERLHPDDKERFQEEFSNTVMSRGTSVHSVYRFVHKAGRMVWIQGDVRIKRDPKTGNAIYVQAVGVDITKLEEAKQKELAEKQKRIDRLASEVHREFGADALVGSSKVMEDLRAMVRRIARSDASVLITGENGTGKELVARALHNSGRRKDKPFVAVNCSAFTETLLESELLGVEANKIPGVKEHMGKFEQADGGTLFLDEIGDMSPSLQAKILRALQEQSFQRVMGSREIHVDVRVIAATHKDLPVLVRENKFRADLYYRLNVVAVQVPSLRDRRMDIVELANFFLRRACRAEKHEVDLSDVARERLMSHSWPGNVRELEHAIRSAVVVCDGNTILPNHLPPAVAGPRPDQAAQAPMPKFYEAVEEVERRLIKQALQAAKGTKAEAARLLGLNVNTLTNKMAYYGIVALQEAPWVNAP